MAQISDLIRDSRLDTYFLPDHRVETVHAYRESDPTGQRRVVNRSEHWKREKKIGGGGYGDVWLEKCTSGGQPNCTFRAVKQMTVDLKYGAIDYNRELEAIAKFSHKRYERCFVRSFGWYEDGDQLFIAMEYLEAGDMFSLLYQKPPLPEIDAKEIADQILEGLDMMHDNGFAHRDLKPNNILIKSHPPNGWWIKIADFGISKRIEEGNVPFSTVRGTQGYIAPERYGLVEQGSEYATDIWALGEIVFQLLTQKPTFKNFALLAKFMAQPDIFPCGELVKLNVSSLGIDFVLAVMNPSPTERLTAKLALSHEWIKKVTETAKTPMKFDFSKTSPMNPTNENLDNPTEDQFAAWSTLSIRPKPANKIPGKALQEETLLDG
ncbi:Tetratricopeptide-like helical [Penicillium cataractarum]|uniref:Tetratricopeptide-like helical n=1 Tax=Penicillium cataractarum TaxID=2100454 RepID=A0A9W9S1R4_9EURO|nr:Tetratricopeptide-like helical [Penicillium cataractarum]KAJ5370386.1 Tetratricopeptide-like helical [Penicillium cataractarum]